MNKQKHAWAVIGAGPAGMIAVGMLLDSGVSGKDILWVDTHFGAGDFGRLWGEVNSNTRVALFSKVLTGINSFQYEKRPRSFAFDALDPNGFTFLKAVTEPLMWVTDHLTQTVDAKKTYVRSLSVESGAWHLTTDAGSYYAEKVILATGSEAKSLDYPSVEKIELNTALTPSALKTACSEEDVVAVFGSSHSSMIAIRHLVERGVKKIVNFYLSPLRYAVLMDDWILYDDTGLKGETAKWVREHVSKNPLPQIERYLGTEEHIDEHLPNCSKVIYAVGFQPRHVPVLNVSLSHYDVSNGIIAPGLFGAGIGFPVAVTDPFGRVEWNVGVWKFLKNMRRTLPLWQQYHL